MGLAFIQKPVDSGDKVPVVINWTSAIGYMLYRDSSIASLFYYKLVLEIREDDASGTLLGIIRQRRNGYATDVSSDKARAFFDIKDMVNSQLVPTTFDQNSTRAPFPTIHKIGVNTTLKPFSHSGDSISGKSQIIQIYSKGYENYSSTATDTPSDETGDAVNDTLWYIKASLALTTARDTITGATPEYIQTEDGFKIYRGHYATNYFLSDIQPMVAQNYHGVNFGTTSEILATVILWLS